MIARAAPALLVLAALSACAPEPLAAPVVAEEPVPGATAAGPDAAARAPDAAACLPGDGDGIGGTGCRVD